LRAVAFPLTDYSAPLTSSPFRPRLGFPGRIACFFLAIISGRAVYSGLMFAAFTIGHHLSISAL
jgi:hypothetical protein